MSGSTRSNQGKSVVSGDQAGRDITKIYQFHSGSPLAELLERFREELVNGNTTHADADELLFLTSPASGDAAREDLSSKLTSAQRGNEIEDAIKQKELFRKLLERYKFHPSAAQLFTYLLSVLLERFRARVRPEINAGALNSQVDTAVSEHVVLPTVGELGGWVEFVQPVHLQGMIFFLTGVCRIRWDPDADVQSRA